MEHLITFSAKSALKRQGGGSRFWGGGGVKILGALGPKTQRIHIPSGVGIQGNEQAGSLTNTGRRQPPLTSTLMSMKPQGEEIDPPRAPLWDPLMTTH